VTERLRVAVLAGGPAALRRGVADVVFPVMHGPYGEDGVLQVKASSEIGLSACARDLAGRA
jgi:D-alanine-D-alanine ligase-like ATP-grasp enzyme